MAKNLIAHLFAFVAVTSLCIYFKIHYAFADLKSFTDVLLNVSGAVFTLMGIWIAFLYPNALSRIVDPNRIAVADFSESLNESKRLSAIVGSVLKSAAVVLAIMTMTLSKVILSNIDWVIVNADLIKQIAFGISTSLFLIQAEAVIGVIFANVMFLNDLHTKRADKQVENDY
ncbi:MAG: hypothetical protein Q7R66_18455 [Undibacterium sp.]|uniref:hypothetical protein n=1 Tax=Undibacterium sp. TaxID=1914977 RepID=UPI00271AAFBD|nr:hypothetical protein [Undibacterium sp.]MDO8654157.1 hypothetical protein [Undibacterium sp.]